MSSGCQDLNFWCHFVCIRSINWTPQLLFFFEAIRGKHQKPITVSSTLNQTDRSLKRCHHEKLTGGGVRGEIFFFFFNSFYPSVSTGSLSYKNTNRWENINNKIRLFQSEHYISFCVLCGVVYWLTSWPHIVQREFRLAWHADLTQVEATSLNCCYSAAPSLRGRMLWPVIEDFTGIIGSLCLSCVLSPETAQRKSSQALTASTSDIKSLIVIGKILRDYSTVEN